MTKNTFSTKGITKVYGEGRSAVHALRGVDLDIPQGEIVVLLGPSGSGKSTLLNILGCLDQPTVGDYLLEGKDVSELEDDDLSQVRGKRLGFIFQSSLKSTDRSETVIFRQTSPQKMIGARMAVCTIALARANLGGLSPTMVGCVFRATLSELLKPLNQRPPQ